MSRDPIADDGCELSDLQRKTTILPWRESKRILIQANLSALVARIESTIASSLREEIHLRTGLRVQKQDDTWIEEIVLRRVDEAGRGLLEIIKLQVDSAAQPRTKIIFKPGDRQRAIEPVESIIDVERACCARE